MIDLETPSSLPSPALQPGAPRFDFYAAIHKALRLFMGDTLFRLGRMDPTDPAALTATLAQLEALLDTCASHVKHENAFVHPAIEARRPGGSSRIAGEHDHHLEAIASLAAQAATLRAQPTPAAALRLYRTTALFIADNLVHMDYEETAHNAALWAAYSDAELIAIHDQLVASIEPATMMTMLRWIVPALSPAEREAVLAGVPQEARAAVLASLPPEHR